MIKRKVSAFPELKIIYGIGLMQKWEYFTSFFKGKNVVGRSSQKGREILLNKKMRELNVANCFEYSLLCFMLNINLTFYNIIKSSVDGDRSQVFWITQKIFKEKNEKEFFLYKESHNQSGKKLVREVKVTIGLQRFLSRQLISTFSSRDFFSFKVIFSSAF